MWFIIINSANFLNWGIYNNFGTLNITASSNSNDTDPTIFYNYNEFYNKTACKSYANVNGYSSDTDCGQYTDDYNNGQPYIGIGKIDITNQNNNIGIFGNFVPKCNQMYMQDTSVYPKLYNFGVIDGNGLFMPCCSIIQPNRCEAGNFYICTAASGYNFKEESINSSGNLQIVQCAGKKGQGSPGCYDGNDIDWVIPTGYTVPYTCNGTTCTEDCQINLITQPWYPQLLLNHAHEYGIVVQVSILLLFLL